MHLRESTTLTLACNYKILIVTCVTFQNKKLNKVVLFGGFTNIVPSAITPTNDTPKRLDFTYYADTFVLDYDTKPPSDSWKHIKRPNISKQTTTKADISTAIAAKPQNPRPPSGPLPLPPKGQIRVDFTTFGPDGRLNTTLVPSEKGETLTEALDLMDTGTELLTKKPLSLTDLTYPGWRHVLTRGFPTYRSQAALHTDPFTGMMYLYGGFTSSDFISSRKAFTTRSFGDLWQLRMDVEGEGGDFSDVDIEDERRTAQAGPWQRCFMCGNAGRWRKCSGSCRGAAFFCGVDCQKEGWKEHKRIHNCRKI